MAEAEKTHLLGRKGGYVVMADAEDGHAARGMQFLARYAPIASIPRCKYCTTNIFLQIPTSLFLSKDEEPFS